MRRLGPPRRAGAGAAPGAEGAAAAAEVAALFLTRPRSHWLALTAPHWLPVTPVNDLDAARRSPVYADAGWMEDLPVPDGASAVPGPFIPSLGRTPARPAPALGEHTAKILAEFGVE